jgi:colicin import membrane protein
MGILPGEWEKVEEEKRKAEEARVAAEKAEQERLKAMTPAEQAEYLETLRLEEEVRMNTLLLEQRRALEELKKQQAEQRARVGKLFRKD